jgi:hypothetical protein
MEDRTAAMQQDILLMAIAVTSMLCGMHFSPYFEPAQILIRPFIAGLGFSSPLLLLYFTSLLLALIALLVGGVPAAIFERATGRTRSDAASLGIWLGGVALIALPVLLAR